MSAPPIFPGQLPQWRQRLSPSLEIAAPWSMKAVLTGEPRLTGADQSENWSGSSASCREASRPGGTGWVGAPGEASRQLARASASNSAPCADADLMDPPCLKSIAACGWEAWKFPHAPLDGLQWEGC